MTQDEIIEMARQAGFEEHQAKFDTRIETFAKLVAEKEREACAKSIEKSRVIELVVFPNDYLISRNDVQKCYDHQHKQCVKAIRARGQA